MLLNSNTTCSVGWVVGAAMMMRADLYRKVGGLSEQIEFYGEEPEFGYRTTKLGYRTIYYADAELIHLGGESTKKVTVNQETQLYCYSLLQRATVGYSKAILMSQIVILAAYLKRLVSSNKTYFTEAIRYEKEVVRYLKKCRREELSNNR